MRAAIASLLFASACAASQPGAVAAIPDQDWVGMICCDTIPDYTRIPLRQPFQVTVRGGVARYDRNIRTADTSFDSGFRESGEGMVGPDGRVTLSGTGTQRAASYQVQYAGVLAGSHTRLDGVQHWRFDQHLPYDRSCHLDLTHQL